MIAWEYWSGPVAAGLVGLVVSRIAAVFVDEVWEWISKKS